MSPINPNVSAIRPGRLEPYDQQELAQRAAALAPERATNTDAVLNTCEQMIMTMMINNWKSAIFSPDTDSLDSDPGAVATLEW
jgi:hypothetical protein